MTKNWKEKTATKWGQQEFPNILEYFMQWDLL